MKTVIGFVCGLIGSMITLLMFAIGLSVGADFEQKKQTEINFKKTE